MRCELPVGAVVSRPNKAGTALEQSHDSRRGFRRVLRPQVVAGSGRDALAQILRSVELVPAHRLSFGNLSLLRAE